MSTINMMFILIFMLNVYIGAMQPGIDGSGNNGGNSTSVSVWSSTSALSSDSAFLTIQELTSLKLKATMKSPSHHPTEMR